MDFETSWPKIPRNMLNLLPGYWHFGMAHVAFCNICLPSMAFLEMRPVYRLLKTVSSKAARSEDPEAYAGRVR